MNDCFFFLFRLEISETRNFGNKKFLRKSNAVRFSLFFIKKIFPPKKVFNTKNGKLSIVYYWPVSHLLLCLNCHHSEFRQRFNSYVQERKLIKRFQSFESATTFHLIANPILRMATSLFEEEKNKR